MKYLPILINIAGMPPPTRYCRMCLGPWHEGHNCGTGAGPRWAAVFLSILMILFCTSAFGQQPTTVYVDRENALEFHAGDLAPAHLIHFTIRRPMAIHLRAGTLGHFNRGTQGQEHLDELHAAVRHALGIDFPLRECRPEETVDTLTGFIRGTSDHHCRDLVVGR